MHDQDAGTAGNRRDRSEIADDVEVQFVIERRVPCVGRGGEVKHVAVRGSFGDRLGRKSSAGSSAVLDEELLAEMLRQPLGDEPRVGVIYTAWREARYDPNWMRGIVLCPRRARASANGGNGRCKIKKLPTACSHDLAPALRNVQRHRRLHTCGFVEKRDRKST